MIFVPLNGVDVNGRIVEAINDSTIKKIPEGAVKINKEEFLNRFNYRISSGTLVYDPLVAAPVALTITDYQRAVQNALDAKARERRYDGILSLCSYSVSGNPTFAAEAAKGIEWRDNAWTTCYQLFSDWETGLISQPTIENVLAAIPPMLWPDES